MEALGIVEAATRDVALPVSAPLRHVREAFDRSVALVLGINRYRHGIPPLKTAVPDARAIAAALEGQHGFRTMLRCDGDVACASLRHTLRTGLRDELGSELTARDRLLLYFAGHGLSRPSEHGPEGQLLLADADPADPQTFYPMSELRSLIGALPCRHVLIVLDCCFAGTFRWAGRSVDRRVDAPAYRETLDRFVGFPAWQVLVSASHEQLAFDSIGSPSAEPISPDVLDLLGSTRIETAQHSPFADAFLRGLAGQADFTKDNLIIATELELFVRDAVERSSQVSQTPQLYKLDKHDRGEFVFQVPGTTLQLEPAPALSLAACPYQGLRPYGSAERARFFGRTRALDALVGRVKARPLTVLVGPSGVGKSSLLAAGLAPALRDAGWTVVEARPGATPDENLRASIEDPDAGGATLYERITAWMARHPSDRLCLILDQAEELETVAGPQPRARTLAGLAQALEAYGTRLRLVLALRTEFEHVVRDSPLARYGEPGAVTVPHLTQDELREIIERPARAQELSFDPPELVDQLINEVLQAPGALPLLSFVLRELYARCAERNHDRLLSQSDYVQIGGMSGALARRAGELLDTLIAGDPAYAGTARRVLLRMTAYRDGEYLRRRVARDELVYRDATENARVEELLTVFKGSRLLVLDRDEWEPAHDLLVRGWATFLAWRDALGAPALVFQHELAEAARRWSAHRRPGNLWHDDARLRIAQRIARDRASELNAREHAFVAASVRRRRNAIAGWVAVAVIAVAGGLATWDLRYRSYVEYYRDYGRRWGEPMGIDRLSTEEARARATSFQLMRTGRWGHISHVDCLSHGELHICVDLRDAARGNAPELAIGERSEGELVPSQWDFEYEVGTGAVSTETARSRSGRVVYRLQYRGGSRERQKAQFLDENGFDARIKGGDAEIVEFVRSPEGLDIEKHYYSRGGARATNQDGISIEKLAYDERGHNLRQAFFDTSDRPVRQKAGYAIIVGEYDDQGNGTAAIVLDERGRPTRGNDGVASTRRRFDAHGNEIAGAFFDATGDPTRGTYGYAGWRSTYDASRRSIETVWLDEAGRPMRSKDGYARARSLLDDRGRAIETAVFDVDGAPARLKEGHAMYRLQYDDRGNKIGQRFFDAVGRPVLVAGRAGWRSRFDDRGNTIETIYLDPQDQPTLDADGIAGWRSKFDARGNQIERTFIDLAGKPTHHKDGYAGWRSKFDDHGNEIERAFFDEAGRPTRDQDGIAGWSSRLDPRGNRIETRYFGAGREPVPSKDGYAGIQWAYDEQGHEIESAYLDVGGRLARKDGVAGWRLELDARGNELRRVYFDEARAPTRQNDGFAEIRTKVDDSGHALEVAYFDQAGAPVRNKHGVAGWRSRFDARGNEIERGYFDDAGRATRHKDGYAGWRGTFNDQGLRTEVTFFDETGAPAVANEGHAGWRTSFDAQGHEILREYFDETGAPTRHPDGYAVERWTLDPRGNAVAGSYLDERGKPTRNQNGVAGWRSSFDDRDHEIETVFLDPDGKPTRHKDGYAGRRTSFDRWGHVIEQMFLDEAGKPLTLKEGHAGWRASHDPWGHQLETVFVDEAGRPVRRSDGYAILRSKLDDRGNKLEVTVFDEADRPIRCKYGYAVIRSQFDDRGNETETAYFDEAGKRVGTAYGYAVIQRAFDRRGNQVAEAYFDEAHRPLRQREGHSGWRATFDDRGNEIERVYLDGAGKPVRRSDGYAIGRLTYDAWANIVAIDSLDEAGRPTRSLTGYAGVRSRYDGHGHPIESTFVDEKGAPLRGAGGFATARAKYDRRGNKIERALFDAKGKPTRGSDGYAVMRATFDDRNKVTDVEFFDELGKPARVRGNVARMRFRYDARGDLIDTVSFDAAGTVVPSK